MRVQAEANKPLLAGLHTLTGAGVFSAAQRVTDVVVVPLTAAVEALLPRAYAAQRPLQTVLRIGIGPICIALLGGCFLFLLAPYAPLLLGASFIGAEAAIKTLALLPTLLVARLLLTVALAAHGSQRYFLSVYGAGAIISISATAWWVPIFGMNGAIAAAYVTELSLIALQGRQLVRAH
jgi:O-antigen/teichoic acid export membrane protein